MRFNTTTVMLALLLTVAWLVGCTDVPTDGPEPPVYESQFRILNADKDLAGATIDFDLGPDISGLAFMQTSDHGLYPSGNRVGIMGTDTMRIAFTSEQRATVMLLPKTGAVREFIKLIERRVFDPPALAVAAELELPINDAAGVHVADTTLVNAQVGRLRIVHGVPGAVVDVTVEGASTALADGNVIANITELAGVEYRDDSGYMTLLTGTYTITLTSPADGSTIATTQVTLGNIRQTTVVVQSGSGVEFVNLQDN